MDIATLRASFPEFSDPDAFPDVQVQFWLAAAGKRLVADVWGDLLDQGTMLFAAHNLTLSRRSVLAAQNGGAGGQATGLVSQKAVDKVSVSYDTASITEDGAGLYNATTYGQMYWQIVMIVGAGGRQL